MVTGGGSSFSADDGSFIDTALHLLSKTVPTSGDEFADLIRNLVDILSHRWRLLQKPKRRSSDRRGLWLLPRSRLVMLLAMLPVCKIGSQIRVGVRKSCWLAPR